MVSVNWWGLGVVAVVMAPNIVWALAHRGEAAPHTGRALELAEQIGRFGVMALLCVNVGPLEFGFGSDEAFAVWLAASAALLLAYWIAWAVFFKRGTRNLALALAVLPSALFVLTGARARHWVLLGFAALFAAAHIAVTHRTYSDKKESQR